MFRQFKSIRNSHGLAPGTLSPSSYEPFPVQIFHWEYDSDSLQYEEYSVQEFLEGKVSLNMNRFHWIAVRGVHDRSLLHYLGERFAIDPLSLEDIANTNHRNKIQLENKIVFLIARIFSMSNGEMHSEQLSLYMRDNVIFSFHEDNFAVFAPILKRLNQKDSKMRTRGSDYLLYALFDFIVDEHIVLVDYFGEQLEKLNDFIFEDLNNNMLNQIYYLRRDVNFFQRSTFPLREMARTLLESDNISFSRNIKKYLFDLYDHIQQIRDNLSFYTESLNNIVDTIYSRQNQRNNEIIRLLTLVSTMFIPLTFLAGVYGMNFRHMPELEWHWIYPYGFWSVIVAIPVGLLFYFRKKKWI